ncbi:MULTISPECIES: helix-turn-helix domain-containing protein [Heyndrickxia]|uniref:helix-turn-helix domain-containing protein n=1 Tax=Heyndrickxia TaxID=2837504 RepID=UPI000363943E|nr:MULTISPECIES: helix-turn-helix transcriptional regulator [Heyndrickxia]APB36733.1 transcriptional regulator [Heyndrickxia coagulans]AVD56745.1 XRE family transcriptional regulator [Heyndrickxia coagulans]MEC2223700.1 helix-turn-helix transcriptional regulator [Weizmannia sp. CD-2023]QPG52526.1 helix-turn-helix domain-containing protein [Heyndrickxia coagulans]WNE60549.1 helix-turn-helix domain-containing protein [Heyndrickxia coagulans]
MIKTERAYKEAVEKLKQDREFIESEKLSFKDMGLTQEQIDLAIQPYISFHEQLKEEVDYYERIKRGEFDTVINLRNIGRTLIAYRIYIGMSQAELAEKLGVAPSQVSRDERNEYYGATIERIRDVMEAMNMFSITKIEPKEVQSA